MDIKHIAKLTRLHITEKEEAIYNDQLGSILKYVNKLKELKTEDVSEFRHTSDVTNVFREDVVEECDSSVREKALENFSNRKEDLLQVQSVFDAR